MAWRLANSLVTLRNQVNAAYPNRDKASDGTIGDAAHAGTVSDHNPNSAGVVTAFDIDSDLNGGNIWDLANSIKTDPRVKYLIVNRQIYINGWQPYNGPDPHTSHLHVSVGNDYDNPKEWNIGGANDMAWKETAEELQAIATQLTAERDAWKKNAEVLQPIATQLDKERNDWKAAAEKVQAIATELTNRLNNSEDKKKLDEIKKLLEI